MSILYECVKSTCIDNCSIVKKYVYYAHVNDLLTHIFLPIARLAIGRGLGFRDLTDPLKRAFLRAASETVQGRATDSRLALMTGLQRRDVVRLRDVGVAPRAPSAPARVVAAWLAHHGEDGPRSLPRSGPAPSFEALARAVRQDVHPRSLLDLLLAAGTVTLDDQDRVHLVARAYAPGGGSPEQLAYLADNLSDHGAAAVANVLSDAGFFDRALHYDGLTDAQVAALSAAFAAEQMDLLRRFNDRAAALQSEDGTGPARIRFGGYAYSERRRDTS